MFTVYKKELELGSKILTLETGKIARQADASVVATYGETVVLATVCFSKKAVEGADFFPLTVNYQEKFYAAGKIPGGFLKRESRPSEKETLTSRLIDRPIRPLFPKQFKNETQVVCTVVSYDGENDADMVALVAASAALTLSGAPFLGPIGGVRIGYIDDKFIVNPTNTERKNSKLDLSVAGTKEGVLMVESEAYELSEETMLAAVELGHEESKRIADAIIELAKAAAKTPYELPELADTSSLESEIKDAFGAQIREAYNIRDKQGRSKALEAIRSEAKAKFTNEESTPDEVNTVKALVKEMESVVLRGDVLSGGLRVDGRKTTEIRPIVAEVDVLPKVHASALFTRGETQALVVTTLGTGSDEQLLDQLDGESKDAFMLHYNFPPYSVGEVGRMGAPGRREIGHGKLARRAIEPMLPTKEAFPYTIRIVSEITESNGSSSMATVCGTSLSLMAAGVPLAKPVSGIAMGLIKEGENFVVLSDILGDEDHLGDMDFKVAGTKDGITALQMDIKITSITMDIMKKALHQAHEGRMHILGKMAIAIESSRSEVSENAPRMEVIMIDKEKIRDVIGSGGKVIRSIIEETGCSVDIDDEGKVVIASNNAENLKRCREIVEGIVAEAEVGKIYKGEVVSITDFGGFVKVLPNQDGLVHVSEIADFRVNNVRDILSEGMVLNVKCLEIERGKVRLTMKGVEQSPEVVAKIEYAKANPSEEKPREPRPDRNGGGNGRKFMKK